MMSHGGSLHTEIRRCGGRGFKWTANIIDKQSWWMAISLWCVKEIKYHCNSPCIGIDISSHISDNEYLLLRASYNPWHWCQYFQSNWEKKLKWDLVGVGVGLWEKQVRGNGTLIAPPPWLTHFPIPLSNNRFPRSPSFLEKQVTKREVFHPPSHFILEAMQCLGGSYQWLMFAARLPRPARGDTSIRKRLGKKLVVAKKGGTVDQWPWPMHRDVYFKWSHQSL